MILDPVLRRRARQIVCQEAEGLVFFRVFSSNVMASAVRTYLEMRDPGDLRQARSAEGDVSAERIEHCSPGFWRFLYTEVGRQYRWIDRLAWTDEKIAAYLANPAIQLWILETGGSVAGYFELRRDEDHSVEIAYIGLLPPFVGRGLGRCLLTAAVEQAWACGAQRVWLHTCSFDHPAALPNYLARGFRIYKTEVYDVPD
jgi:GNAT superfamily N-acetyltransferase